MNQRTPIDGMQRPSSQKRKRNNMLLTLIIILLIILGGMGWYILNQESENINTESVEYIVEKVGQLIELPVGEEPTVATVTEPEKLADQPFFENAKEGDKVLMYTQAGKAYLYDPIQHKLIEAAPINIDLF